MKTQPKPKQPIVPSRESQSKGSLEARSRRTSASLSADAGQKDDLVPRRAEHIEFSGETRPSQTLTALDLSATATAYVAREFARTGLDEPKQSSSISALSLASHAGARGLDIRKLHPVLDAIGPRMLQAIKNQTHAKDVQLKRAVERLNAGDIAGFEEIMGESLQSFLAKIPQG